MKNSKIVQAIGKSMVLSMGLVASSTFAQITPIYDVIDTDNPVIAGSGCDQSDTYVSSMSDFRGNSVLAVELSRLRADLRGYLTAQRVSCSIVTKVNIPAGMRLRVTALTAYGFQSSQGAVQSTAGLRMSLLGKEVAILRKDFAGNRYEDSEVILHKNFLPGEVVSPCSRSLQKGLLSLAGIVNAVAKNKFADSVIDLSHIELAYKLDRCP